MHAEKYRNVSPLRPELYCMIKIQQTGKIANTMGMMYFFFHGHDKKYYKKSMKMLTSIWLCAILLLLNQRQQVFVKAFRFPAEVRVLCSYVRFICLKRFDE